MAEGYQIAMSEATYRSPGVAELLAEVNAELEELSTPRRRCRRRWACAGGPCIEKRDTNSSMLTRRGFVTWIGGAAMLAGLPGCGDNINLPEGLFLDEHQWRTLEAATGHVVPGSTSEPGAREALVVAYIDTLLGAFEVTPPAIFAGGPASGRQPFPDTRGAPTTTYPERAFERFLPLSRVRAIAWRIRLYGSAQTEGGDFNDLVVGPRDGLRDLYGAGVRELDKAAQELDAQRLYVQLTDEDQRRALDLVAARAPAFYRALVEHTLEGMFAAPEYGGNLYLRGWQLVDYDGDSIPLGHAFFDEAAQRYIDRPDQPTAQPSPGAVTETFDDDVLQLLTDAAVASGGKRFF